MGTLEVIGSRIPRARVAGNDALIGARGLRDGSLSVTDMVQALIIEGRGHMLQLGTEDAPIASTTSIDDALVSAVVDIADGYTIIPFFAEAVVGTWTTSTLLNFMIEVDNAKVRYSSGGTAFTPLGLRTGSGIAIASQATAYVGPDVTVAAKSAGGSLELKRQSVEVNLGDAADAHPLFEYAPRILPIIDGPASLLYHFGAASADVTFYGNIQWCEVPTEFL